MTKYVGRFFTDDEFVCRNCGTGRVHQRLVEILDAARTALGPLEITSGVRCHDPGRCTHNRDIGGRKSSYHIPQTTAVNSGHIDLGLAADVTFSRRSLRQPINILRLYITLERFAHPAPIGLGIYPTWVHIDVRSLATGRGATPGAARWEEHFPYPRLK